MGLFGGSSSVSSAQGQSSVALNSSGWVIGTGDAKGGSTSQAGSAALPWYGWLSVAVIGFAYWRHKVKGKKNG